jgi:hypothetical protein
LILPCKERFFGFDVANLSIYEGQEFLDYLQEITRISILYLSYLHPSPFCRFASVCVHRSIRVIKSDRVRGKASEHDHIKA